MKKAILLSGGCAFFYWRQGVAQKGVESLVGQTSYEGGDYYGV